MLKNLVSRSEFARRAGVSAAAVTQACRAALEPALSGKRIDLAHPAAVAYLERRLAESTPPPAEGIDCRYQEAVDKCREGGRWSADHLRKSMGVGSERAKRLVNTMRANGLIPDPAERKAAPPPHPEDLNWTSRVVSGNEAARATKKTHAQRRLADELAAGTVVHEVPDDIQAFADMTLRELIGRFGTDVAFVDWLKATQVIEAINEKRLKNATTQGLLVSRELVKVGIVEPIDSAHIKLLTDGATTIARRSTAMHAAGRELDEIEAFVKDQISSFIRPVKSKVARALKNA